MGPSTTSQDLLSIDDKTVTAGRETTTTATTRNKNDKKDDITTPRIPFVTKSNKDANTGISNKPLISILSDNDVNESTVVSLMQHQQQQRRISENESDDTMNTIKTTTTTQSLISPSSLVSPFISVVGESHNDDDIHNDGGTPLLTEVSITRIPKGRKSERDEESHQTSAWNVSSTKPVHDNQIYRATTSVGGRLLHNIVSEEKKITDSDEEEENFGRKNILKFQQDLEGMFERQRRNKTANKAKTKDED